ELPETAGRVGFHAAGGRFALADDSGVVVGPWEPELVPRLRGAEIVTHDFKSQPRELLRAGIAPADDTMIAAYLIEARRPAYVLDELADEYGVEVRPDPAAEEETEFLVRQAEATRRLAGLMRARLVERGSAELYDEVELPLTFVLAAMEDAGVRIDTYRMGEI